MTAAGQAQPSHELAPTDEDHHALAFTTLRQLVDSCKTFEDEVVRGCVCREDVFERFTQFDKSLEQAVELASASGSGSGSAPSQTNSDMSCDCQDGDPDDENVIKRYFTSTKIFGDSLKSRSQMFWPLAGRGGS